MTKARDMKLLLFDFGIERTYQRNLKEHVKVVTLRNRKDLNAPKPLKKSEKERKTIEKEEVEEKKLKEEEVVPSRICFVNKPPPYVPLVPYP